MQPDKLFLYGDIGFAPCSAEYVIYQLREFKGNADLEIHINSMGGKGLEGVAIYNALKAYPAKKTVYIDAVAASAASLVAMAGDRIVMPRNAFLMIHEPQVTGSFTPAGMASNMDLMEGMADNCAEIYASRCRRKKEDIRDMMQAETWMTAETAKKEGFCDEVVDEVPIAAHADLSHFKNVPQAVVNLFGKPAVPADGTQIHTGKEIQKMHAKTQAFFKALLPKLGLAGEYDPETFDHDAAMAKVDQLMAAPKTVEVAPPALASTLGCDAKASLNELLAAAVAMKNRTDVVPAEKYDAAMQELTTLRTEAMLASAVHIDHKLTPKQAEPGSEFHKLATENPEAFRLALAKMPQVKMHSGVTDPSVPAANAAAPGVSMKAPAGVSPEDFAGYMASIADCPAAQARFKAAPEASQKAYVAFWAKNNPVK